MVDDRLFAIFGVKEEQLAPKITPASMSHPKRSAPDHNPVWTPMIMFCPETLIVKEVVLDMWQPKSFWFTSTTGVQISATFIAPVELKDTIQAEFDKIIDMRTKVLLFENKTIGKVHCLAREAREEVKKCEIGAIY